MITIAGQKGGNGRSVTAVNLAASLALLEKRTLLVDCDPRACSTLFAGFGASTLSCDLSSVLFGKVAPSDAVFKTRLRFMDLLPASFNLFHAASRLSLNAGNERILRIFLRELRAEYEYMIIDSPASYSFLTVTALAAADWLLVPFQCSPEDIGDFTSLLRMVRHVRSNFQERLKIAGLLFNRCGSREEIDRFLAGNDLNGVENIVYKSFVPGDDAIRAAGEDGKPVALYDVESPGARAYLDVAKEVISSFN
ncbi:MAG: ParA family protein [Desulfobacteraceae bacterium]|nr:ParA family protein [Desulfobacteraceae bacterium]